MKRSPTMSWGTAMFLVLLAFFCMLAYFMVIAMRQNIDLENATPYETSQAYQGRMQEVANARQHPLTLSLSTGLVLLAGPPNATGQIDFRRADASVRDRSIPFQLDSAGKFSLPAADLSPGAWRAIVIYNAGGVPCYAEFQLLQP